MEKIFLHPLSADDAHFPPFHGILAHPRHGVRHGLHMDGRHTVPRGAEVVIFGDLVDQFLAAAHVCGDDGAARGKALQNGERHPLRDGGEHGKIELSQPLGHVDRAKKGDVRDLDASEIEVRIGATWIAPEIYRDFMEELFDTPGYLVGRVIDIRYSEASGAWNISGKNADSDRNVLTTATYGTSRINAYKILEETLNLKDVRIYDTKIDAEENES